MELHVLYLGKPSSKDFQKLYPICELFLSVEPRYKRAYRLELRLSGRVEESPPYREERMSNGHKDFDGGVDQRFLAVVGRTSDSSTIIMWLMRLDQEASSSRTHLLSGMRVQ